MKLSVIQRILCGFAVLLILLLVVAGTGVVGIKQMESKLGQVTGEVSTLVSGSHDINQGLMAANTTLLQYLLVESHEDLADLEALFDEQKQVFMDSVDNLGVQVAPDSPMAEALAEIQNRAGVFFDVAAQAFQFHQEELKNRDKVSASKLDLKDALMFAIEDLAFVKEDGETPEIQFAASYVISQTESLQATVNDYFDQSDYRELEALRDVMKNNLNGVDDKLQYVDDDGVKDMLKEIKASILDEDEVINAYYNYLYLQEKSVEQASMLSLNLEEVSRLTNLLLEEATKARDQARLSASQTASFSMTSAIAVVLISILVAVLVASWVSRSIRGPLSKVMTVLGKIAEGDFTQRADVKSQDEFGELSKWVNDLVDKLDVVIREIRVASEKVAASAQESVVIAGQSKELMNSQNEQTTSVASAMTEMAATVQEVARSAETTLSQVQNVDAKATNNRSQMDRNIATIEHLTSEIEDASKVVDQLNEHSKNIGNILEVIQGIAEQTNLLALNAAIEAARAGEQGRGFAVVADEVRTLATRTHTSTEEIQKVISQLQDGVKQTVISMENSCSSAREGVKMAQSVGDSIGEMQESVAEIRHLSTQIATAAEQQSAVAQEISQSVHEIAGMANEASEAADKTAQGSEGLADLAVHQRHLLSQFKISE